MDSQYQNLWDLFSNKFIGTPIEIASISITNSITQDSVKHSIEVGLTADFEQFPVQDFEPHDFSPARGSGSMKDAVADVISQLNHSLTKANEVLKWHNSIKAMIGKRLLIRGEDFYNGPAFCRPARYRIGTDSPGFYPYIDFPPHFIASKHRIDVPVKTIAQTREWRAGYILAEVDSIGSFWVPCSDLKPSLLNDKGPIVGTERAAWIDE